jgi:hypothetical protein
MFTTGVSGRAFYFSRSDFTGHFIVGMRYALESACLRLNCTTTIPASNRRLGFRAMPKSRSPNVCDINSRNGTSGPPRYSHLCWLDRSNATDSISRVRLAPCANRRFFAQLDSNGTRKRSILILNRRRLFDRRGIRRRAVVGRRLFGRRSMRVFDPRKFVGVHRARLSVGGRRRIPAPFDS